MIRHTKISDDNFALQNLQGKNWPYFVERLLTVSQDKKTFEFSTKSSVEENKIIYDTRENLALCKSVYGVIYIDVADNFREYLQSLPQNEFDDLDQDLRANGFSFKISETKSIQKKSLMHSIIFSILMGNFQTI